MPTYLISQSDFVDRVYLPASITSTVYSNKIAPAVNEAQEMDLQAILHSDFYDEVMEVAASGVDSANGKLTKVNYDALLPYLKPIVIYFAYARYIGRADLVNSRYGPVNKSNEYSEPLSEGKVNRIQKEERSKAMHHVKKMEDYLEDNLSKYTTWNSKRGNNDSKRTALRIWST